MLKKIYRIEHGINNLGPYCNLQHSDPKLKAFANVVANAHAGVWHESMLDDVLPEYESLVKWGSGWYCGFDSILKMQEWFKGLIPGLHEHGYVLKVYEVPISSLVYTISGRQILFEKPKEPIEILQLC